MRFIQKLQSDKVSKIKVTKKGSEALSQWTQIHLEDALSKRFWQDEQWRIGLRQYEAIPDPKRSRPYKENVVIEIPLGAKQCDTIVSAVTDLIFSTSPIFTVRGSSGYEDHAYAVQLLVDKLMLDSFTNYSPTVKELITDTVMMGTGLATAISSEEVVKHARFNAIDRGPRCFSIPPEDFIVPGGAFQDMEGMSLCGYRIYYNEAELREVAAQNGWDVSGFKYAGNVSWVRQRRELVAKTYEDTQKLGNLYEVFVLYAYFDYDNDGYAEDILFVYDRTSRAIGHISFNPYDTRPIVVSRYQPRPHIFYGLGVLEMAAPFQVEISEWHNFKMANAHLANSRMWAYRIGSPGIGEELEIGPNKAIGLANPKEDLVDLVMADVYQSAMQYEMQAISLAEQRVGTAELGGGPITAGKRVPAATAMSILQQQNRRFATPFNNMREAAASLMAQCVLRLREQYLLGGDFQKDALTFIVKSVGAKYSNLIEELFRSPSNDLRDFVTIEITASSASINREADKQSALMLMQVLGQYYDKMMQISQILFNPMLPPEMKKLAVDISKASSIAVERLLRTFDNVRDPKQFIPEMIQEMGNENKGLGGAPEGSPGNPPPAGGIPEQPLGGGQEPVDIGEGISTDVPVAGGVLGDTSAIR